MARPEITGRRPSASDSTAMAEKLPRTMTVPEAGKYYFGICANTAYDAAKRGEIPTVRIGRRLRVPTAAMERMMRGDLVMMRREDTDHDE
jgi:excisionase family DNA binding protein